MDYRRFGNQIILRIDKGEEILTQLEELAFKEKLVLAHVSALGAVNSFTEFLTLVKRSFTPMSLRVILK